ncbi:MAG: alpha/beta hydrolase [Rhodospirillales bacterium]
MATTSPLGERHIIGGHGIDLSVSVAGKGPLVILMHGWPEQSLSWRHQVPALVQAGYRVATPDMRGYGGSGKPEQPEAYTLDIVAEDMGAVAAALGAERWVAVGHDWGAMAAWRCAMFHPERVAAVFGMSVPHTSPAPMPLLALIDALFPDRFFYIRYFQQVGVGEAELAAADTATALKQIFYGGSGDGIRNRAIRQVPRDAKLLESWAGAPAGELAFLPDAELARYASAFDAGGWRGPLNWYRNFDRNAEDARALGDSVIHQPAAFLAGELEPVLMFWPGQLENMRAHLADLRTEVRPAGIGHWVQQEAPAETNAALLEFLAGVRERL